MRRVVTMHTMAKSTLLRCTGARMNGPVAGTLSRPVTVMRQNTRQNAATIARIVRYHSVFMPSIPRSLRPTRATCRPLPKTRGDIGARFARSCEVPEHEADDLVDRLVGGVDHECAVRLLERRRIPRR